MTTSRYSEATIRFDSSGHTLLIGRIFKWAGTVPSTSWRVLSLLALNQLLTHTKHFPKDRCHDNTQNMNNISHSSSLLERWDRRFKTIVLNTLRGKHIQTGTSLNLVTCDFCLQATTRCYKSLTFTVVPFKSVKHKTMKVRVQIGQNLSVWLSTSWRLKTWWHTDKLAVWWLGSFL